MPRRKICKDMIEIGIDWRLLTKKLLRFPCFSVCSSVSCLGRTAASVKGDWLWESRLPLTSWLGCQRIDPPDARKSTEIAVYSVNGRSYPHGYSRNLCVRRQVGTRPSFH